MIDLTRHAKMYQAARDLADASGLPKRNLCAATASQHFMAAGMLSEVHYWTAYLISELEKQAHTLITNPADLLPGDFVASLDVNENGAPDHVYFIYGNPYQRNNKWYASVVDNYNAKPHVRNLGVGKRTPMDYAMRFAASPPTLTDAQNTRALSAFKTLYSFEASLPRSTKRLLNLLRIETIWPPQE